ncbi:MAG: hypothetical protein ABIO79_05095 [Ferruginibacter sp.]
MNKTTKTTLQFMIAGILFASLACTGCNSTEEKKTGTNDTVIVSPGSMEVTKPDVIDTTKKDTARTRPTPNPN